MLLDIVPALFVCAFVDILGVLKGLHDGRLAVQTEHQAEDPFHPLLHLTI